MKTIPLLTLLSLTGFSLLWPPTMAYTKERTQPGYQTRDFKISLIARTSNQTVAFYTGRGFPRKALEELRSMCFITIGIKNKSSSRVWFDLSGWRFSTSDGLIKRRLRSEWTQRWNTINLQARFQSTFRWTLMPEKMGLYPYEGEGGNITLHQTVQPITLTGSITVGKDKTIYPIKITNIFCASDK